jgi:hypothetical protein
MTNNSNTEDLFTKIKKLSDEAIASYHTKPKAKPYVEQLKFLRHDLPENPVSKKIFDDLVCHVEEASGHGRNKEHWLSFVSRDVILLEWELKRTGNNDGL